MHLILVMGFFVLMNSKMNDYNMLSYIKHNSSKKIFENVIVRKEEFPKYLSII